MSKKVDEVAKRIERIAKRYRWGLEKVRLKDIKIPPIRVRSYFEEDMLRLFKHTVKS